MSGSLYSQKWEELNNQLKRYFTDGNLNKASSLSIKALNQARKEFGTDHINYGKASYNVGLIKQVVDYDAEVENYFRDAKRIFEINHQTKEVIYIQILYRLAIYYQFRENYNQALQLLTDASNLIIPINSLTS